MRKLSNSSFSSIIAIAILTAAVLTLFGRTLGSYFLADDFGEVAYVSRIFNGDLALLWSNFTGNYMQVPSMAVYRPWLLMTLLFDFAVWRTNAFGYYLTNLLHFLLCAVLIFALVRQLTGYWGSLRSTLAALFSALLFAVNPLHCESISWVVGRVDIVCLAYYLLALNAAALFARSSRKRWLAAAAGCFWIAVCTKEMAIGLPVVASLIGFLFASRPSEPDSAPRWQAGDRLEPARHSGSWNEPPPEGSPESPDSSFGTPAVPVALKPAIAVLSPASDRLAAFAKAQITMRERLQVALPLAVVLFLSMAVYFVIRYLCLGTMGGGYVGSIGTSQLESILQKWTDLDSLMRIFYPLNQSVFGAGATEKSILSVVYAGLLSLAAARLLFGNLPRRWLLLLLAMASTALAPIYQLYGIGYDLEGSRFVFFLTASLSMFLPVLLFAPLEKRSETSPQPKRQAGQNAQMDRFGSRLLWSSVLALSLLVIVYASIAERNNRPWVHAGKQTRALSVQAPELARSIPRGKLVAVVGIPKDSGGAHMILNNVTFRNLLSPPFVDQSGTDKLTGKILTFDPVLFGDLNRIDRRHFREALLNPDVERFLRWDMESKQFLEFFPRAPQAVSAALPVSLQAAAGITVGGLSVQPANYDFLRLIVSVPDRSALENQNCKLSFQSTGGEKSSFDLVLSGQNIQPVSKTGRKDPSGRSMRMETIAVHVPLSYYWRWYAFGSIASISLELPPAPMQVEAAELVPYSCLAPEVEVLYRKSASDGAYNVRRRQPVELTLSTATPCKSFEVQILKKNFFFENLKGEALVNENSRVISNVEAAGGKATVEIPKADLEDGRGGYVQLRARCLDDANQPIGQYSLPVTLRLAW